MTKTEEKPCLTCLKPISPKVLALGGTQNPDSEYLTNIVKYHILNPIKNIRNIEIQIAYTKVIKRDVVTEMLKCV